MMTRLLPLSAVLILACKGPVDDTASPDHPVDADHDGYFSDQDCDDDNATVFPGAQEICNERDDDCDGYVDDDDPDVEGRVMLQQDADLDGYGSMDPHAVDAFCTQPDEGWVADDSDCDDTDPGVNPGAEESCNGVDDDCDGETDEGAIGSDWYPDGDGDGYGIGSVTATACNQPSGTAAVDGDCNDDDPSVNPGATEVCNEIDDDCDSEIDEGTTADTWYRDTDGDGYGTSLSMVSCGQPSGFVAETGDCDDDDDTINPGASEICNGLDDDCDTVTDGAGMVALVKSDGSSVDLSSTFAAGTASGAANYAISSSGTLYLCEGSYHAELSIEAASVAIVGLDGSELVSLTGDGSGAIISTTTGCANLSVQGLTISDGASTVGGCLYGGYHGIALSLYDVVMTGCAASDAGGGLFQYGGTLAADAIDIASCDGGSYGGGIYLQGLSGEISSAALEANNASYGGGLAAVGCDLVIEDTEVSDNTATGAGGGLALNSSTVELNASLVWANAASSTTSGAEAVGGGAVLDERSELGCTGSTAFSFGFLENSADYGGGVFITDSDSALSSDLCDWGGGLSDNSPDDITLMIAYESYDAYGTDESFECTGATGCE